MYQLLDHYFEPHFLTMLLAAIAAGAAGTPPEMLNRLMAELDLFVGNTPQHDDVTCLLVKAE